MPANTEFKSRQRETFLQMIEDGLPIGIACRKMGIDPATFYRWQQRADRYNPEDEDTREHRPCYLLFQKINRARAAALQKLLEEIKQTGMDCRAAPSHRRLRDLIFLGETLFPSFFRSRSDIEIDEVAEKLFKELQRLAAAERENKAADREIDPRENWKKLPEKLDDSDENSEK